MTSLPFLAQSSSDSDSDSDDSNGDNKNNNSNSNNANHNNNNNPNARRMDMDLDSSTFRIVPRPQDCDSLLRGAQKNDPQLCRDLITLLNVPPSYGNAIGQTALHVAVLWGHIEAAEVLIELGANVNATNTMMGSTPLHTALMSPKTSHAMKERLVDQLLAAGAKTWMEDLQRKPPIQYVPPDHPNLQRLHEKLKPPKRNIADQLLGDMISGVSFCKPAR